MKKGESLQQVADAVGVSKAHIWELEKGTSKNPSTNLLQKLAGHYDTTIAALIGEDPNESGEEPELVAMFRDLKALSDRDRETIKGLMKIMQTPKENGDEN